MAYQSPTDPNVAICVSIDEIKVANSAAEEGTTSSSPFECKPDGSTMCKYFKDGKEFFSLGC